MKKEWQSPRLIVLVRSRPEESLTLWCKSNGVQGSSPNDEHAKCGYLDVQCYQCQMNTES